MLNILITDKIDKSIVDQVKNLKFLFDYQPEITPQDLIKIISNYQGLVVRSRTKVTQEVIDKGHNLKVIGRVGSGLDNIEVKEAKKRKIVEVLSGIGLIEVSNYHITHKKDQTEKMNVPEKRGSFIEVIGSKTEYTALRENLSHYLLKNFSENVDSEYPQKIFEVGKIFISENSGQKIRESENLSVAVSPGNFT